MFLPTQTSNWTSPSISMSSKSSPSLPLASVAGCALLASKAFVIIGWFFNSILLFYFYFLPVVIKLFHKFYLEERCRRASQFQHPRKEPKRRVQHQDHHVRSRGQRGAGKETKLSEPQPVPERLPF